MSEFDDPAVAIIKHANPCGVALGDDLYGAYRRALACDETSAFGGIVACNRPLDGSVATAITEIFTEVVIAPEADDAALAVFAQKPNLRLVLTGGLADPSAPELLVKSIAGGLLVQSRDDASAGADDFRVVTAQQLRRDHPQYPPTRRYRRPNTIVLVAGVATLGIGAGQMSCVDSAHPHPQSGRSRAECPRCRCRVGCVFSFADGTGADRRGGVAVVQLGGSLRDKEVIAAADAAGLAMVFTSLALPPLIADLQEHGPVTEAYLQA